MDGAKKTKKEAPEIRQIENPRGLSKWRRRRQAQEILRRQN